jgi:hypothetical protein
VQAKPKQIGLNPQQRFRSIPWGIEVVNSQEPLTSAAAGLKPRQQSRLEIAEMQNTSWRWSEAAAITASLPSAGGPDRAGEGDGSDNALKKAASSAASANKLFEGISPERDL